MHLLNSFECLLLLCNWQPPRVLTYKGGIIGIGFVFCNSCLAEIMRSTREDVLEFELGVCSACVLKTISLSSSVISESQRKKSPSDTNVTFCGFAGGQEPNNYSPYFVNFVLFTWDRTLTNETQLNSALVFAYLHRVCKQLLCKICKKSLSYTIFSTF